MDKYIFISFKYLNPLKYVIHFLHVKTFQSVCSKCINVMHFFFILYLDVKSRIMSMDKNAAVYGKIKITKLSLRYLSHSFLSMTYIIHVISYCIHNIWNARCALTANRTTRYV